MEFHPGKCQDDALQDSKQDGSGRQQPVPGRWNSILESARMMLYKIQNGMVVVDGSQYLTLINQPTRHNHTQAFIVP